MRGCSLQHTPRSYLSWSLSHYRFSWMWCCTGYGSGVEFLTELLHLVIFSLSVYLGICISAWMTVWIKRPGQALGCAAVTHSICRGSEITNKSSRILQFKAGGVALLPGRITERKREIVRWWMNGSTFIRVIINSSVRVSLEQSEIRKAAEIRPGNLRNHRTKNHWRHIDSIDVCKGTEVWEWKIFFILVHIIHSTAIPSGFNFHTLPSNHI